MNARARIRTSSLLDLRGLLVLAVLLLAATASAASRPADANLFIKSAVPHAVTPYKSPQLSVEDKKLIIAGTNGTAGLMTVFDLDPTRKYRLTISGHPLSGTANLRLRHDSDSPQWEHVPDGFRSEVIYTTHQLEVLIYADVPFSYALQEIRLEECPDCILPPSQDELKKLLANSLFDRTVPYSGATLQLSQEGLLISGAGGGSRGLFLYYELPETEIYAITTRGRAIKGKAPTLRVTQESGQPRWLQMPSASLPLFIQGPGKLELLIYADDVFTYRLESLTLKRCDACLDNGALKARILKEVPALEETLPRPSPLAAAELITNWVANHVPWPSTSGNSRQEASLLHKQVEETTAMIQAVSPGVAFGEYLLPLKGVSICGGMALLLKKTLGLFGIDAFIIDTGSRQFMTHVVVIVPVQDDGNWSFYLFDPTFNLVLRSPQSDSGYLDFFSALDSLGRPHQNYVLAARPLNARTYLSTCRKGDVCIGSDQKWRKVSQPFWGLEYVWKINRKALRKAGLSTNPEKGYLQLLRDRVYSVGKCAMPDAVKAFKIELSRRGIPCGSNAQTVRPFPVRYPS